MKNIDLFLATSINAKIFYDGNKDIFSLLSNKELLNLRTNIRDTYKTIIVGANTIKNDNPSLLNSNKNNIRIIIDKYADIDLNSKIFTIMPQKTYLILLVNNNDYENYLRKIGVNIIKMCKSDEKKIIEKIKQISSGNILVEGGAKIIGMFLKNKFIDNIKIIQFPIILPSSSTPFCNGLIDLINLDLIESYSIDSKYIYSCYSVKK